MHPPLFKPHPLCKKEIEDLVKCHQDNPWAKFLNACGDVKITLDLCFREEKKLRKELNNKSAKKGPYDFRPSTPEGGSTAS